MAIMTASSAMMAQSPQWVGFWAFSADGDGSDEASAPPDAADSTVFDGGLSQSVESQTRAFADEEGGHNAARLAAEIFAATPREQGFGDGFRSGNVPSPAYLSSASPIQRLMALVLEPEAARNGAASARQRDMWLSELASRLEVSHHDDLVAGAAGIALLFDRTSRELDAVCSNLKQARLIMEQTWPVLSRHLLLDEAIVYPLCGYVGQSYGGSADSLDLLFRSLEREHQQVAAALEMIRHKLSQVSRDKHCPDLIELSQAVEFFGYAWETHATKVDRVLLPRLRHVLNGPAQDGILGARNQTGHRY